MYIRAVGCLLRSLILQCWGGNSSATKALWVPCHCQSYSGLPTQITHLLSHIPGSSRVSMRSLLDFWKLSQNNHWPFCAETSLALHPAAQAGKDRGLGHRNLSLCLVTETEYPLLPFLPSSRPGLQPESCQGGANIALTHHKHMWRSGRLPPLHHYPPSSQPLCVLAANRPRRGQTHGRQLLAAPPWKGSYSF